MQPCHIVFPSCVSSLMLYVLVAFTRPGGLPERYRPRFPFWCKMIRPHYTPLRYILWIIYNKLIRQQARCYYRIHYLSIYMYKNTLLSILLRKIKIFVLLSKALLLSHLMGQLRLSQQPFHYLSIYMYTTHYLVFCYIHSSSSQGRKQIDQTTSKMLLPYSLFIYLYVHNTLLSILLHPFVKFPGKKTTQISNQFFFHEESLDVITNVTSSK